MVRKWFNIRSKAHDFHADDAAAAGRRGGDDDEWRGSSFTRREPSTAKKSRTERPSRRSREHSRRGKIDLDAAEATVTMDYRCVHSPLCICTNASCWLIDSTFFLARV